MYATSPAAWSGEKQAWLAVGVNGPAARHSRLLVWFDAHARSRDNFEDLGVSIVRPGIGWQVNDRLALWLGYARVIARLDVADIAEDRIWQQATYPVASFAGGRLSGRTRLEQRQIDGQSETIHRIRQNFRWTRPIGDSNWSWLLANEIFFNLNSTDFGAQSGYQQNRAFFGISRQFSAGPRLELAYLNNHLNNPSGKNPVNHNLALGLSHSW